jgi:radical SAM protein with 4Fe4S-binding SPASM domain
MIKGYMDQLLFNKVLTECSSYLFSLILYFQGEPFLHHGIFEMIKMASKKQIYTITSTNGQNLNPELANRIVESGLNEIIISMDGMDQATYEKYRIGGDIEKVKMGIRNLIESKKVLHKNHPEITLQFLVFSHNQHQVNEVRDWGKMTGVDRVTIKTARITDFKGGNPLIPDNKYSRYRQLDNNKYEIKNKLKNHCWRSWSKSVITWDGNVLPCCFDRKSEHIMGNIKAKSFNKVWKGDRYKSFRSQVLRDRKAIPMCSNCTVGVIYSVK